MTSTKPAPREPARQALAEAIAARQSLESFLAQARQAEQTANEAVWRAREALQAAKEAATSAKGAVIDHLADKAMGLTTAAPTSMRSARAMEADALDELEVAEAAREKIRQRITESERQLEPAQRKVQQAAIAVLRDSPATAAMISRAEVLRRELFDIAMVVAWMSRKDVIPSRDPDTFEPIRSAGLTLARRLTNPPLNWDDLRNEVPGSAPWQAALEALMVDADAPLPS